MATEIGSDELNDTVGGEHNRLKTLGKYRIEKRIGAGGMGTVFLAVDDSLNRTVALKVLPKDRAENPVLVRRFKAEGQAAAHLEHPNIVRVFEAGEADGFLYMALEYIEGIDVHELVERRGVVPVKRSTDIIRQTTLALQHAHDKGIVHRDIKPSNLLIKRDGSVKLADLGLARSIDDTLETNITRAGTTVGTVDYMAPEQARSSKAADVRSDIYSLGCTWYHMLTGHPPFPDGSMTNKLQAHAVSARPDPRSENERIPEGIVAVIQRMMACKPDDRYQGPQELLDDLEAAGKMHRGVDQSVLAALADDAADVEEAEEVHEPDLRMVGDIDSADLAALRESGEHVVDESARNPKPIKPRSKKESGRRARRQQRTEPVPPTKTGSDAGSEQPSKFNTGKPRKHKPTDSPPSGAAERGSTRPAGIDEETPRTRSPWRKSSNQSTSVDAQKTPRQTAKRGTVTTAGGDAPALPGKVTSLPVDGSSKNSMDLEALKYLIPAVLVVGVLGVIGYAIINSGDALSSPDGANPYADGSPDHSGDPSPVVPPQPNEDPQADPPAEEPAEDLPPETTPQVTLLPFPGAEDASPTAGGTRLIPDWVNAFRAPRRITERSLIVRRRPGGGGDEVASLNEAFTKLPRGGGTIELAGDGPFRLAPAEIVDRGRVRIQAADGRRPVVHLVFDEDRPGRPLLQFSGTDLELQGVHFVLADEGAEGAVVFQISRGNVNVQDCSLTVNRMQPEPMTGFQIVGSTNRPLDAATGRCLFENVVIRGDGLTCIALAGPSTDLVAGNCLFVSGAAPALVVTDRGMGGAAADNPDQASRGVRLLASTILSSGSAVELAAQGNESSVAECHLITRMSVLATGSSAPAMVTLRGWPQRDGELGGIRADGLTWSVGESAFVGWGSLLRWVKTNGGPQTQVPPSTDAWRKFWNQPLRTGSVIAEALPNPTPAEATPDQLQNELAALVPSLAEGQVPGCRPAEFEPLPLGLIAHVVAVTRQPYEPDWLGAGMTVRGEPLRFDLSTRRSLSRYLASDACADGTHVIAFGSGLKEIEPFVIADKSVRLELENTGKSPLVLQPKPGRDGTPAEQAWMTVRSGTLDLVNARLRIPASRTTAYPDSAILLEDASLAVRNSTIEGPWLKTGSGAALVRWVRGEGPGRDRAVLVEDSYLVGLTSLLSGPVHWQTLVLRNSLLASGSDAIDVNAESPEQLPAALTLDHCTLAAGGAAIRAEVTPEAAAADALTLFVRASVFAGPIGAAARSSAVVAHTAGAADNHRVIWWGSANGYSSRLSGFRVDGAGSPGDFERGWLAGWGAGHEANPLTGATDVLFASPIVDLKLLELGSFELSHGATASSWGPLREPIGVSAEELGPRQREADPSSTRPSTGGRPAVGPRRPNPGF